MNKGIQKLCSIASKDSRLIIGLMSGTSLDGLDIALCHIAGNGMNTKVELVKFDSIAYDNHFKELVRSVFAKSTVDLERLCLLNSWVAKQHAAMIIDCLKKWNIDREDVDLVASHGQTIYHAPKFLHPNDEFGNATLQIGDGDHLAVATGIITISDFRQKHIAGGGEGAPLAVYGDHFIFSKQGENRVMLNIGGIANFTYLPGSMDTKSIFSTDTGPGNTLMDAYARKHFQKAFDKDSAIARSGTVNEILLSELISLPFFENDFPKTTGPELFNLDYVDNAIKRSGIAPVSETDVMSTLNRFTAVTIVNALQKTLDQDQSFSIYTSGGGMHNPLLMEQISSMLPHHTFQTTDSLGINPDAKEAVLFAILANECVAGGNEFIGKGKDVPSVAMGKISLPS